MVTAYNISSDLSEAQQMADALEDYVRGTELYGHLPNGFFGSGGHSALTIGALLLRLRRLTSKQNQLNPTQRHQLQTIQSTWQQIRTTWRVHYEDKLIQEAKSRLRDLNTYVEEAAASPHTASVNYPIEALRRTILAEVLGEIETLGLESDDIAAQRRHVDSQLRGLVHSVPFQWDTSLQDVYPDLEFWWLYQSPEDAPAQE